MKWRPWSFGSSRVHCKACMACRRVERIRVGMWVRLWCDQHLPSLLAKPAVDIQSWEHQCVSEWVEAFVHSGLDTRVASYCASNFNSPHKIYMSYPFSWQTQLGRPILFPPFQFLSISTFCQFLTFQIFVVLELLDKRHSARVFLSWG